MNSIVRPQWETVMQVFSSYNSARVTSAVVLACCLGASSAASASTVFCPPGLVCIQGGFLQYFGAVGNGDTQGGFASNPYLFQTYMNGAQVYPADPIPGLEAYFFPADPNDPGAMNTGLGHASVDLQGAQEINFWTEYDYDDPFDDPDQGVNHVVDVLNYIQFTPGPAAEVGVGDEFLLGTFAVQNGVFFAADAIHKFSFSFTTYSDDPALSGHTYADVLEHVVTPNATVYTPEQVADFFRFQGHPEIGSFRVYEYYSGLPFQGAIELWGRIGSLEPTQLVDGDPNDGVFFEQSVDPYPIDPPTPTPAPAVAVLLALGLGGTWVLRRRSVQSESRASG